MIREIRERRLLDVREVLQDDVLAGSESGRDGLLKLVGAAGPDPEKPTLLILDFSGIRIATASYLRESVFALRDLLRVRRSFFYPVIADACSPVRDEIGVLVRLRNDVVLTCMIDRTGNPTCPNLVGALDPKQQQTFDLVQAYGETDARELFDSQAKAEAVGHTAWNNRLASLASLGLVAEIPRGRTKRFRALLASNRNGD
jgi:hypothetical protein